MIKNIYRLYYNLKLPDKIFENDMKKS